MNSRALKPEGTNQVRRHGFGIRNVALIIALIYAASGCSSAGPICTEPSHKSASILAR